MVFIHQMTCVSPQKYLPPKEREEILDCVDNVLRVIEPTYEGIPLSVLRRMGKAVRMGVGAAMPLLKNADKPLDGIIIGTANGGMEDCIKFLNQVIEFEEGTLTPTNFVQSTTNAVASQLGMMSRNQGYNITHVNRGLAVENALLDVMMLLKENSSCAYLVGGVEEISTYNYNIDFLAGSYKKERISNVDLYRSTTIGSIAGEGAAMFVMNAQSHGAIASLDAIKLLPINEEVELEQQLKLFLKEHLAADEQIDTYIAPENGDVRLFPFFNAVELSLKDTNLVRYKHLTGDFATVSAFSLYIACRFIEDQNIPEHMIKQRDPHAKGINKILIYNNHKGEQHSFMLVSKA
jgi:Beta-ketoacyl synthase, N-terminal domain